ncbi:MAG: MATE family efflux transporter [Limisphaerales bacterium]
MMDESAAGRAARGLSRDARSIGGELRVTLKLGLPIMAGLVGQMVMGLTDTVMVGQLGTLPLAAASFAHNLIHVPFVAVMGLITSVAVTSSHAFGAKDPVGAGQALRHGLGLAAAAGLVSALLLLAVRDHCGWLRQPPEVVAEARAYTGWVAWSLIPALLAMVIKQYCEALNRPWPPTWILFGGVLLNVLLNWLWIFGHAGFPALGLEGAGLATLVARLATLAGMMVYLWRARDLAPWLPARWFATWDTAVIRRQLTLGLPVGLQHLLEVGAFVMGAFMMGWIGAEALAAHQIALTCASTTFIFALGFGMAVGIRVGHAWGARDPLGLKRIGWGGIAVGALMMSGFALLFFLARTPIANAFVSAPEVAALAAGLLLVAAFFQVFDGLQVVAMSALRGLGDVRVPAAIAAVAYWLVALPLAALLAFGLEWGATGIWIGLASGLATAAGGLVWRFQVKSRRAS